MRSATFSFHFIELEVADLCFCGAGLMCRRTREAVTAGKVSIFLWPMAWACATGLSLGGREQDGGCFEAL